MSKCIICGNKTLNNSLLSEKPIHEIQCPNCGWYRVTDKLQRIARLEDVSDAELKTFSRYLKETNINYEYPNSKNVLCLTIENYKDKIKNALMSPLIPKTIGETISKLMLFLSNNCTLGMMTNINREDMVDIAYLNNYPELTEIINELATDGYIESQKRGDIYEIKLKVKGIKFIEDLKQKPNLSNSVFVAMKFSDDLKKAHYEAIKPACEECGFDAFLISDIQHNEGITDKIIAEIKNSRFVIVDLTYNNCGAYFEAGYAQGRGLTVIRTCKKEWFEATDDKGNRQNFLHFDVAHYNCIIWENNEDLKEQLENRIRATIL